MKDKKIEVKRSARYPGRDMAWTETLTSSESTTSEIRAYHYTDSRIKAFFPKETCFFDEYSQRGSGFVYELTIPANTEINRYGDEIRVNITEDMAINYIGEIEYLRDYEKGKIGQPLVTIRENTIYGNNKIEL